MIKKIFILFLLGIILGLLTACQTIPPEKRCLKDEDCVPATCCHASEAVNKKYGPLCQGKLCSAECVPFTLDCGQGEIKCQQGKCLVVLKEKK